MAVWLALASKDVIGKIFGIFFPIMAFVAMGFEHSVGATLTAGGQLPEAATAAMDAFRTAVSEHLNWGTLFYKNLIPVSIGNIIGGGIFVGTSYWYSYLRKPARAAAAS